MATPLAELGGGEPVVSSAPLTDAATVEQVVTSAPLTDASTVEQTLATSVPAKYNGVLPREDAIKLIVYGMVIATLGASAMYPTSNPHLITSVLRMATTECDDIIDQHCPPDEFFANHSSKLFHNKRYQQLAAQHDRLIKYAKKKLRGPTAKEIQRTMDQLGKTADQLVIVSVGSGKGHTEYQLMCELGIKIVCIDPTDDWGTGGVKMRPLYSSVKAYLKDNPGPIDCLLIWYPYPGNSTYDYEAIQLLRPTTAIIMLEKSQTAGGDMLWNFLSCVPIMGTKRQFMVKRSKSERPLGQQVNPNEYTGRWVAGDPIDPNGHMCGPFHFALAVLNHN